jgi:hypothetical protein
MSITKIALLIFGGVLMVQFAELVLRISPMVILATGAFAILLVMIYVIRKAD